MKTIIKLFKQSISLLSEIIPTVILCCLCLYMFINFGFIKINGSSMEPTYVQDDLVFIQKNVKDYQKGDIVIVNAKDYLMDTLIIKRIIADGGDTIEIKKGKVYVNNQLIKEDFINPMSTNEKLEKVTLAKDEVFIMGDNRQNSTDSRVFGNVNIKDIEGKVIYDKDWLKKLGVFLP